MKEGTETDVPTPELGLYVGEEAEFDFLASTHRHDDVPGVILERWPAEELTELPPLRTTLEATTSEEAGQAVPIRIVARVTELGTIELACRSRVDDRIWKLEYNVRQTETGE